MSVLNINIEELLKELDPKNDTKWMFENHFNVDIKVVLDRQPLLGAGPLPNWVRDCARGRAGSNGCS